MRHRHSRTTCDVIDDCNPQAVEPTRAAQEIPTECRILSEEDRRGELHSKRLQRHLVFIGRKRASYSLECFKPVGFCIQSEHLRVLALEDAIRCAVSSLASSSTECCSVLIATGISIPATDPRIDERLRILGRLARYQPGTNGSGTQSAHE